MAGKVVVGRCIGHIGLSGLGGRRGHAAFEERLGAADPLGNLLQIPVKKDSFVSRHIPFYTGFIPAEGKLEIEKKRTVGEFL